MNYELVIIGGGPAGLTAGLYAAREKINTLLIEKIGSGGQIVLSENIENFPGFPEGIPGLELAKRMEEQARKFGLEIISDEAIKLIIENENLKIVETVNKKYETQAVIVASGANARRLGIPGENRLIGRGVSYCATCDGPFFKKSEVAVIGGGDTAVQEAIFLTKYADKVYLIHRREQLRAVSLLQERAKNNPKIFFVWNSIPLEIIGEQRVEGIKIKNLKTNKENNIGLKGVFILIGTDPQTKYLNNLVKMDENGYIFTDENMQVFRRDTGQSCGGLYACGDCRKKLLRQVVTACGEGATAAFAAARYIENLKK